MTTTTKLGLKKPDTTDFYSVDDFNDNADTIDGAIGTANGIASLDENGKVPSAQIDNTIAPTEYNPSSTYQNGALTFHNGILYQNTSGSSVSGTWVEGYWSQVRIGNVATLSYTVVGTY